ncbi:MAG: hypothetical protein C4523_19885 [Myxococcales bacterium]|nr:MAG: hypothetical protein C4523_19885 [Myxococcales bacterium]
MPQQVKKAVFRPVGRASVPSWRLMLALAALLLPGAALAQTPEPSAEFAQPAAAPAAPDGFYLRLAVGPAFAHFSTRYDDHEFVLMGAALAPELAAGFTVAEKLELTLGLSGTVMIAPGMEMSVLGQDESINRNQATQINAGVGLTYYLPYDFYIGGSAAVSYFVLTLNERGLNEAAGHIYSLNPDAVDFRKQLPDSTESAYGIVGGHHLGFAAQIQVGKEWAVSEDAGLGLGVQYLFAVYPKFLSGAEEQAAGRDRILWLGHSAALMLSATYN